jgi:putative membrane protein
MPGWDYDMNHGWGYGWVGGLFMLITMILFWGGLITVAVILVRRFGPHAAPHQDSAHRILDERFARGEIDRDEYESRRQALRGGGAGSSTRQTSNG